MATLLDGVNSVLKRVQIIKGENQELTTLTDSSIQHEIDVCVQMWNEVIEDLYADNTELFPIEGAESTITLVAGQREYDLPSDLAQIRFPLMEDTNGYFIYECPDFEKLRASQQIPSNYTGRPNFAIISPVTGKLYMDYIPTSQEAGLVYRILYDKDISVSGYTSEFPFSAQVYRALIPCVAELWKLENRRTFNEAVYKKRMGQASKYMTKKPVNSSYFPR